MKRAVEIETEWCVFVAVHRIAASDTGVHTLAREYAKKYRETSDAPIRNGSAKGRTILSAIRISTWRVTNLPQIFAPTLEAFVFNRGLLEAFVSNRGLPELRLQSWTPLSPIGLA